MKNRKESIKAGLKTVAAVVIASTLFIQPARADDNTPYLINIQNYTNSILGVVNTIPTFLTTIAKMATSFLASDNGGSDPIDWSTNWSNEQTWLASISSDALNSESNQYSMQQQLMTTFFGTSNINANPAVPANMNDLNYLTLLNQPLLSPDPRQGVNASMNYLINSSSLGVQLTPPGAGWRGPASAQKNYLAYYDSITAVQTYNAFVLSRLYQDAQSQATDFSLRKQLIAQSSNSSWFSSVISNDLGWVLRQLLLYTSQSYVLMDQLVQTQKQMSATLAMTNTLIIVGNQFLGNSLLQQAQGSTS